MQQHSQKAVFRMINIALFVGLMMCVGSLSSHAQTTPNTEKPSTSVTTPAAPQISIPVTSPVVIAPKDVKTETKQPDFKIETTPLPAPVAPTTVSPLPTPIVPPAAAPVTQQTAPTPSQPAISAPTTAPTLPSVASPPSPLTTLIPNAGDSVNVDSVVIPAKPVAIFKGKTTWESAFERITSAIRTIDEAIAKEGLRVAGRPITLFISTDDNGFMFEVMRPIDRLVEGKTALNDQVRLGTTPEGKALRFVHKGPYDDVDSTYEAVTAYLDAKGVVVKDSFLEEYVSELTKSDDPNLEINIFVQPK